MGPASLSPARLLSLFLPIGCLCFTILLGLRGAGYAPDSAHYRLLALGQRAQVPAPFSARILGPALAGWLGRATGLGVDDGFLILGVLCLVTLLALVAGYLWSWKAPATLFAAIFLMPFWVDMFHDFYLPDLLHAVLLAAMLGCLLTGRNWLAMLLLFPAYLARESTILVAFCLIFAGWRRMSRGTAALGVLAILAGGLVSGHYGHGGPASVHQLSGGVYILGKVIWSLFKNVLGLPLWSNTLPECTPVWVTPLPHGLHFGAIRMVGLCQPSPWGPGRLLLAWFGIFGLGPAFAFALWRKMLLPGSLEGRLWRQQMYLPPSDRSFLLSSGAILVFRFCCIYGADQYPDDAITRSQRGSTGGVWMAVLFRDSALVYRSVLSANGLPPGGPGVSAPGYLLVNLVRVQTRNNRLCAHRIGGVGFERAGLFPR